jgi:shikimate kinase
VAAVTAYLTGFMGTGKSAVGRALARRLRRPFVDLDAEIERGAGAAVAEIFARRGERAFRRLERAALAEAARRRGAVVALGGGALLDASSRALVARTGTLVRLTCARRELARRLRGSRAARPLLAGGRLEARIGALRRARRGADAEAAFSVSTTRRSPAAAAALIARRLS